MNKRFATVFLLCLVMGVAAGASSAPLLTSQGFLTPELHWYAVPDRGQLWEDMVSRGQVSLDAESGNYALSYEEPEGGILTWVFEPANKVDAEVSCEVSYDSVSGLYTYCYTLANGNAARQTLRRFGVEHEGCDILNAQPPSGEQPEGSLMWLFIADFTRLPIATWTNVIEDDQGLAPGESASGFSFQSSCGPGYVRCYAQGSVPIPGPFEYGRAPADPRPIFVGNAAEGITLGPVPGGSLNLGSRYVPLRRALAGAGWSFTWQHSQKRAIAKKDDAVLSLAPGSDSVVLNGASLRMPVSTRLENGRVLVAADLLPHLSSFRTTRHD